MLQPHPVSTDGLDLLSKLLQFDPSKRITSSEALYHPFFINNEENAQFVTTNTTKATSALFDLPIIPLSPFQLEEEYSQWDLLKRASPTVYNNNQTHESQQIQSKEQVDYCASSPLPSFPRTNSYPSELYNITSCDNNVTEHCMMKRSVSDLSIPSTIPQEISIIHSQKGKQQQQQKKKPINRLSLWARKHITV